jgi:radical SAM superfamily enzyme YgiQ (UPF0313 family)
MKLHLINAPMVETVGFSKGDLGESMYPQMGILYLAGYVQKKLPDVEILVTDGMLKGEEETLKEIKEFGAQVVGISCLTPNASGAFRLSKIIKRRKRGVVVVLGGIHPTSLPEESLKKSKCDLVVLGEGELVLTDILESFFSDKEKKSLRKINGVGYLEKGKFRQNAFGKPMMDLDKIPFPARNLVEMSEYRGWIFSRKKPETNIFSTRGCPFDCHFCSNLVWKLRPPYLRLRSPENIMDEVEVLVDDFRIREYFDFADEINSSIEWLKSVCREKIRRKIDIPWRAMLRADKMTRGLAKLLAKSGCWYVNLGIESGNQETLDGIGKKITLKQVESTCKLLKEQGIKVCGLFMLFNVWEKSGELGYEGVEETEKTLEFARQLLKKDLIQNTWFSKTTPYPGSELYETAVKYNLISKKYEGKWEEWNHAWSLVMKLPGVSEEEMRRVRAKALRMQMWNQVRTGDLLRRDVGFLISRGKVFFKYLFADK